MAFLPGLVATLLPKAIGIGKRVVRDVAEGKVKSLKDVGHSLLKGAGEEIPIVKQVTDLLNVKVPGALDNKKLYKDDENKLYAKLMEELKKNKSFSDSEVGGIMRRTKDLIKELDAKERINQLIMMIDASKDKRSIDHQFEELEQEAISSISDKIYNILSRNKSISKDKIHMITQNISERSVNINEARKALKDVIDGKLEKYFLPKETGEDKFNKKEKKRLDDLRYQIKNKLRKLVMPNDLEKRYAEILKRVQKEPGGIEHGLKRENEMLDLQIKDKQHKGMKNIVATSKNENIHPIMGNMRPDIKNKIDNKIEDLKRKMEELIKKKKKKIKFISAI